ncbi:hypothetical protein ONR57_15970 [Hoyosella sp. YIM 151337]|uniref:hypothetical protein n=1 Tax=Hoyosella sp. YIM 151337 TaxID=2992742 RepID=UPI0022360753|nr:hypothetical protein [Hoyosella sp. YIM 151337]MCW4354803.1 hypothetical protein [Hoyosella sp. YIM 151337]
MNSGDQVRRAASQGVPEPPFSCEELASYAGDVYDSAVSAHMEAHIHADPLSGPTLEAIGRVQGALAAIRVPEDGDEMPPSVAHRIEVTLAGIARDADTPCNVDVTTDSTSVVRMQARHTRARRALAIVGTVAAAGIAIIGGTGILGDRVSDDRLGPPANAQSQSPLSVEADHSVAGNPPGITTSVSGGMLSALSQREPGLLDHSAVAECVAAHGFTGNVQVIGTRHEVIDGADAVVLLLPDTESSRIVALTVRPDCASDNPALVSRVLLGS